MTKQNFLRLTSAIFLVIIVIGLMGSGISPSAYSLIQNGAVSVTRRSTLNFVNGGCVDNAGTKATDCTITGGSGTSNYSQSFTSQTSVVLAHNLATTSVVLACYDGSTPPVQIFPNSITITDSNNVTVTFSIAQTGRCVVNGSTSSGGSGTTFTLANASSTGTTSATLTKLTGAPSTAVIAAITDTGGVIGITTSGAGTTGSATITFAGSVSCVFDGATTAGDYVQISSSVAGNCHDIGSATYPTSGQVIGRVLSTNGSGGTFILDLFPSEIKGGSGGGGGVSYHYQYITAANARASGSVQALSQFNTPQALAATGTNGPLGGFTSIGLVQYPTGGSQSAIITRIPATWDGSAITFDADWTSNGGSGTVTTTPYSLCLANAGDVNTVTWNAGTNVTVTPGVGGGYIQGPSALSIPLTGCSAGNLIYIGIVRQAGDSFADTVFLFGGNLGIKY